MMNAEITRLQKCCDEQCECLAYAMQTGNLIMQIDAHARLQVFSNELKIETERWEAAVRRAEESLYKQGVSA